MDKATPQSKELSESRFVTMISIKIGNRDWINLFCNNYDILPDSAFLQEHVDQPRLVGLIYYHSWFPHYILEFFPKSNKAYAHFTCPAKTASLLTFGEMFQITAATLVMLYLPF